MAHADDHRWRGCLTNAMGAGYCTYRITSMRRAVRRCSRVGLSPTLGMGYHGRPADPGAEALPPRIDAHPGDLAPAARHPSPRLLHATT